MADLSTGPCATCGREHVQGVWWPRHPYKTTVTSPKVQEVSMTVDVSGLPEVRALVDCLVRVREEIDIAVRGIRPDAAHMPESLQQKWPQLRVVRLADDAAEIRIGGARWTVRYDQWDEASKFLEHVRHFWDMRVVWADAGTPVDGDCAKRLLDENESLRGVLQRIVEIGEDPATNKKDMMRVFKLADDALNLASTPRVGEPKEGGNG